MSCTFDNVDCTKCDDCEYIRELDQANDRIEDLEGDYGDLEAEIYRLESKLSDLEYETNRYENSIILTEECNNLYDEAKCNILKKLYELPLDILEEIEKVYV